MTKRQRRQLNTNNRSSLFKGKGDRILSLVILGLVLFGSLMVYSGSVPIAAVQDRTPYYFFVKHMQFVVLGIVLFIIAYNIDYHLYPKIIVPLIIFTTFLLILVLFMPPIQGSHRWLDLKIATFQVSDLAKLTLSLYLASWLSKPQKIHPNKSEMGQYLVNNLLPFLLVLGLFSFLIIIQPNLSTTMLIGIISISIYFVAGKELVHNIGTAGIFITLGISGIIAGIIAPYRFLRITTFLQFLLSGDLQEPFGRDYQLRQILIAVGTGKLFGAGFSQSKQKFSYLTETALSDSIFAIFAEEFGFFGSVILISIFLWIMFRGFKIAANAPDKLGALIASGIVIWITAQAFIHFAVNVGLIPLTGMPLPFISYGGSSLVTLMFATGILVNISRHSDEYE